MPGTPIRGSGVRERYVWVEVAGYDVYGLYLPPSVSLDEYAATLDELTGRIRANGRPVVMMGDFNAHHHAWRSDRICPRGANGLVPSTWT